METYHAPSGLLRKSVSSFIFRSSSSSFSFLAFAHSRVDFFIFFRFSIKCQLILPGSLSLYFLKVAWNKEMKDSYLSHKDLNLKGAPGFLCGPLISRRMGSWLDKPPSQTQCLKTEDLATNTSLRRKWSNFFSTLSLPILLFLQVGLGLTRFTSISCVDTSLFRKK